MTQQQLNINAALTENVSIKRSVQHAVSSVSMELIGGHSHRPSVNRTPSERPKTCRTNECSALELLVEANEHVKKSKILL